MSNLNRIEASFLEKNLDPIGESIKNDVLEDLGIAGIETLRYAEAFYLDFPLSQKELSQIAEKVFIDPLFQGAFINQNSFKKFDYSLEVKFHPDVTDNVGIVSLEAVSDFLGKKMEGTVRTSRKYYFFGTITKSDVERIAREMLANGVIETYSIEAGK
mgnify:CR=1 FL=1